MDFVRLVYGLYYSLFILSLAPTVRIVLKIARDERMNFFKRLLVPKKRKFG